VLSLQLSAGGAQVPPPHTSSPARPLLFGVFAARDVESLDFLDDIEAPQPLDWVA
jgi:hypothetical protein